MIDSIKLFNNAKIRARDENQEEWYFSIIDVIAVLTESENPRNYWKVLKHRLNNEGSQVVTNCSQLRNNYLIKKKRCDNLSRFGFF